MTFREEFKDYLEKHKISQNKAGEGAGYTGSVVSQWLGGTYKGDGDAVEAALRAWMERDKSRRERRSIPTVDTEAMRKITTAIAIAHEERDIAVIAGPAGTGKTTALARYEREHPGSAILIEADESMNQVVLIQELASRLGIDNKMSYPELVQTVSKDLAERDIAVMIDETDYLKDNSMELLRRVVNDKGRSCLVLAGLQRLIFRIKNLKNNHQQIASRVGVLLEVEEMKSVDAEKILLSVWSDLDKETIAAFVKAAGGSVRTLAKLVDRAHRTAVTNDVAKPDPDIVRVAGSLIMR